MDKLQDLQDVAIDELLRFFKAASAAKQDGWIKDSAKLAVSSLAAVGRIKATERAKDATQLMVLRSITDDKKIFRKYVAISMPHLNPAKQIEMKGEK